MSVIPRLHRTAQAWLPEGPLAAQVPSYVARLKHGGYASSTCEQHLSGLAHFAHWMSLRRLPASKLDESRHSTAMHLLHGGERAETIALWLGHESPTTTHHYVEPDLEMKQRALAKLQEPPGAARRYKAPDSLIAFLKSL